MTLLIVDDSPLARHVLKSAAASHYRMVLEAGSVAAVESLLDTQPTTLVSDFELPDGDGMDVVALVRAASPNVRIAFFTANAPAAEARGAGTHGTVFRKPQDLPQLTAWLAQSDDTSH